MALKWVAGRLAGGPSPPYPAAVGLCLLTAHGPRRGPAALVQPHRPPVLLRLGRARRAAVAAHRPPGGLRELVLAEVAAVAGHGGRVAARLALGDPPEHDPRVPGRRLVRGQPQRSEGLLPRDSVDRQAVRPLEAPHRA